MKGMINEFVVTASSISPCVERKTRRNCFIIRIVGYFDKKLSYRRVTARCVLSAVILQITTQQCRNYLYDKS